MSALTKYLFAFLINNTAAGSSPYSLQLMPECGTDPQQPTCTVAPVCSLPSPLCAAPRFNQYRGGWVRVETREAAAERYRRAAEAITRTIARTQLCLDDGGNVMDDCEPLWWPSSTRSLACMVTTISIHESGYREDVMGGYSPMGRGGEGEVCVMQIMPRFIGNDEFTPWMTTTQRELPLTERLELVLGSDPSSLDHCYETGLRILSRKRRNVRYSCRGIDWAYATFAFYGTGNRCIVSADEEQAIKDGQLNAAMIGPSEDDWAAARLKTYNKCMDRWPNAALPQWAKPFSP